MKKLFPSLPENAGLADVFQSFPDTVKPLLVYHDALLRGDSPLSIAQRELIAAYAAGWNERALFDAIQTCALFNFMNRILEGTGVAAYPIAPDAVSEDDLKSRQTRGYCDWGRAIGVLD